VGGSPDEQAPADSRDSTNSEIGENIEYVDICGFSWLVSYILLNINYFAVYGLKHR